ncbi:LHFPL tetraspan subfamily member 5 protein [Cylas formicarius]|uniref:LHFPL tetraspan subfamily member 5 protein n=1 Tax=Cylas formicarius TaxID=197179 RepID=UPI00295891EA|nr:LHFPL tetraspan subfamily member 5 protein [Cylas formicarius]
MGSKIEYVDSSQIYATNYVRNSKAIGVLWGVFTICYNIIVVVSFVTSEWIGNAKGQNPGKFGLWSMCVAEESSEICKGRLENFLNLSNPAFQTSAILIALAALFAFIVTFAMILFFFCRSTRVFKICAWVQLFSGIALIGGCCSYPAGWADLNVKKVCGLTSGIYNLGECGMRWAYILAAIGCLDAIVLSILAFILANRHVSLQPEPQYAPASIFKGETNSAFVSDSASVVGSRKSLSIRPIVMMAPGQEDTYSQFSQRTIPRSVHSGHYSHLHSLHKNFQL